MSSVKELFDAYKQGEFPHEGGYIVSSFSQEHYMYVKYEMISYSNVKDLYLSEEGLTFQADGKKIFWLIEPYNYPNKSIEPTYRVDSEKIPYRMKEVEIYTTKHQSRVLIGKQPTHSYTSFTVLKPTEQDVSDLLYLNKDILETAEKYFVKALYHKGGITHVDAQKVAKILVKIFDQIIVKTPE